MRLSNFIRENAKAIINEWVSFAQSLNPNIHLSKLQLKDHISEILNFIAKDIELPQTSPEQLKKSHGESDSLNKEDSAAEIHGAIRHDEGFDIIEMVAEYRALRASVTKLWAKTSDNLSQEDILDLTRFNESIDQALAESVVRFTKAVDHSKDLLLGILGHDIRSPLGAMTMSAHLITKVGPLNEKQIFLASQIESSGARITGIVSDLLDLTRTRTGTGLTVVKQPLDIAILAQQIIDELRTQPPARSIVLDVQGDCTGQWDSTRLGQVISNLIGNAIQYGSPTAPVSVVITGDDQKVTISVHNEGAPILPHKMGTLFDSFTRAVSENKVSHTRTSNLGLGLFISREIAYAHGGDIRVTSTRTDGTTFIVEVPK